MAYLGALELAIEYLNNKYFAQEDNNPTAYPSTYEVLSVAKLFNDFLDGRKIKDNNADPMAGLINVCSNVDVEPVHYTSEGVTITEADLQYLPIMDSNDSAFLIDRIIGEETPDVSTTSHSIFNEDDFVKDPENQCYVADESPSVYFDRENDDEIRWSKLTNATD